MLRVRRAATSLYPRWRFQRHFDGETSPASLFPSQATPRCRVRSRFVLLPSFLTLALFLSRSFFLSFAFAIARSLSLSFVCSYTLFLSSPLSLSFILSLSLSHRPLKDPCNYGAVTHNPITERRIAILPTGKRLFPSRLYLLTLAVLAVHSTDTPQVALQQFGDRASSVSLPPRRPRSLTLSISLSRSRSRSPTVPSRSYRK